MAENGDDTNPGVHFDESEAAPPSSPPPAKRRSSTQAELAMLRQAYQQQAEMLAILHGQISRLESNMVERSTRIEEKLDQLLQEASASAHPELQRLARVVGTGTPQNGE